MAKSQRSIRINIEDDVTLDYLTSAGYEVRLSYPDEDPDRYIYNSILPVDDVNKVEIISTDNVPPVRKSFKVDFKAALDATYWMGYAEADEKIPKNSIVKIERGQIYEVKSRDSEPIIIPAEFERNWAPADGFGFHNSFSASPVLFDSDPFDSDQTDPDQSYLDLSDPERQKILTLWVPGTGIIYPPPSKIQVWFEKTLRSDDFYPQFITADQSLKFAVPFDYQQDEAKVVYSERTGWKLYAEGEESQGETASAKAPVEAVPVKALPGTVSGKIAPNGIPTGSQATRKLATRRRAVQS